METEVADIGVAARMSWAAQRENTRPEDEAYCLMGLFGIYMSTLYGEGHNAFRRLQEEIMKQSVDTSIFAWGGYSDERGQDGHFAIRRHNEISRCGCYALDDASLLAASPADFRGCGTSRFTRRFSEKSIKRTRVDDVVSSHTFFLIAVKPLTDILNSYQEASFRLRHLLLQGCPVYLPSPSRHTASSPMFQSSRLPASLSPSCTPLKTTSS